MVRKYVVIIRAIFGSAIITIILIHSNIVLLIIHRLNSHDWIESELKGSGFEVYHQYYSVQDPTGGPPINGSNLYGILRACRSSSTESLVLLAPDNIRNDYNYGIVVLLGLAKYLSSNEYLIFPL